MEAPYHASTEEERIAGYCVDFHLQSTSLHLRITIEKGTFSSDRIFIQWSFLWDLCSKPVLIGRFPVHI